jgi:exopolysaccharide biosynthesis predicted pyruvyltransferase EpsI
VLCLLLGIPHQLVPDRHGKLRAFHETWTQGSELAAFEAAAPPARPAACA